MAVAGVLDEGVGEDLEGGGHFGTSALHAGDGVDGAVGAVVGVGLRLGVVLEAEELGEERGAVAALELELLLGELELELV